MFAWGVVLLAALACGVLASSPEPVFPEIYNEGAASRHGSRIVSGWEAEEGQFPFQLSMRAINPVGSVGACGATIIHEEWGLTAAHCTAGRITLMLRAGVVNMTTPLYLFETTEYYNHPGWDSDRPTNVQPNDIGVIKFGFRLEFNPLVQPIRLQPSEDANRDYTGEVLIASGWGNTWTQGTSPENLNWVFLRGISNLQCLWWYNINPPIVVDSTICAQYYNVTSQSTCQGDSGGPLTVYDLDGGLSQVGVSSFVSGAGCHTEHPAGFARPGAYHEWIRDVTGINLDWNHAGTTTEPVETTVTTSTTQPESGEATITPCLDDCDDESDTSSSDQSNCADCESTDEESEEEELPSYLKYKDDGLFGILLR